VNWDTSHQVFEAAFVCEGMHVLGILKGVQHVQSNPAGKIDARLPASLARIETNILMVARHNSLLFFVSPAASTITFV
jgi:hypothetical protein